MNPFDYRTIPLQGKHLVEASAGTGKTYSLALIFLRLILQGVLPEKILVVTFTNAATAELKDRIRKFLRQSLSAANGCAVTDKDITDLINQADPAGIQDKIQAILDHFDELSIHTIHSFCHRVLNDYPFETDSFFNLELLKDDSDLLKEVIHDFFRIWIYPENPLISLKKHTISYYKELLKLKLQNPNAIIDLGIRLGTIEQAKARLTQADECFKDYIRLHGKAICLEVMPILAFRRKPSEIQTLHALCDTLQNFADHDWFSTDFIEDISIFSKLRKLVSFPKGLSFDSLSLETRIMVDRVEELIVVLDQVMIQLDYVFLDFSREHLDHAMNQKQVMTFDDTLVRLRRALRDKAYSERITHTLQQRFKVALIDEFQDTDPVQAEIVTTIFLDNSQSSCYLIGDPKQAIYGFRGADVYAYLNLSQQSWINQYTMQINYRSTPGMIQAVEKVFSRPDPFATEELIHFTEVKPSDQITNQRFMMADRPAVPLVVWHLVPEKLENGYRDKKNEKIRSGVIQNYLAELITFEIRHLLDVRNGYRIDGNSVQPHDIAILVRKGKEAIACKRNLEQHHIPATIDNSDSVFQSWETQEIRIIMDSVLRHNSLAGIKGVYLLDCMADYASGKIFGENQDGLSMADGLNLNEILLETLLDRFKTYYRVWCQFGCWKMFNQIMTDFQIRPNLLSYPDGERRLTNWIQIIELLQTEETEHHLLPMEIYRRMNEWIIEDQVSPDEHEIRLESDEDAVRIMTIHKSKGLEFPIVFSPFLYHCSIGLKKIFGINHQKPSAEEQDGHAYQTHIYLLKNGSTENVSAKQALEDNLRLAYVAMTRAKYRFYTAWGQFNTKGVSALDYLLGYSVDRNGNEISEYSPEAVNRLAESPDLFQVVDDFSYLSDTGRDFIPAWSSQSVPFLPARLFNRQMNTGWKVTSYSALAAGLRPSHSESDRDILRGISSEQSGFHPDTPLDFFAFPRGSHAGTACHEIFENIDFQQTDHTETIREVLQRNGYGYPSSHDWMPAFQTMLRHVLSHPLGNPDRSFRLMDISQHDRLSEISFCFPLQRVPKGFFIPRENLDTGQFEHSDHTETVEGFVHGFIDLVFHYHEHYYLVDWKSNYFGDRYDDYNLERMEEEMNKSGYILQYHLYTVALNSYLRRCLGRKYNYQTHFGGVFYLFIRGIQPELITRNTPPTGIYFVKPPEEEIRDWNRQLVGSDEMTYV